MSSEPRQRRAFRLPLPQEVAWKGALEATSHAVLGGLRHIRREAAKKQNQVAEAIDHVRREAGHRLQNCLSHLERPISSAPAFAVRRSIPCTPDRRQTTICAPRPSLAIFVRILSENWPSAKKISKRSSFPFSFILWCTRIKASCHCRPT